MRAVTQTRLYEGPELRGSCVQACVASIFELPEAMAPTEPDVYPWTHLHYPGLQFVQINHEPQVQPSVPIGHHGYWIASVHTQTEGFTDKCGRCWEFEGNEHGPPLCDPPRPCPFCGAQWGQPKGIRPGYHAIVMRNSKVEHDPNPNCDWDRDRVFVGASWWVARDPSRIAPRALPVKADAPAAAVVTAARRLVRAEGEGHDALIDDAHFQLLRAVTDYSAAERDAEAA